MKNKRHMRIMELISKESVYTQEELCQRLRELGEDVTQATVSRDIKEMKLVKVADASGRSRYAAVTEPAGGLTARMMRVFSETVISIDHSANIILVRTLSGSGNAAAEAMDSLRWPEILGTIAGDNTILAVVKEGHTSEEVAAKLRALIR